MIQRAGVVNGLSFFSKETWSTGWGEIVCSIKTDLRDKTTKKKHKRVDTDKNWSRLIQWNFFNWKNSAQNNFSFFHKLRTQRHQRRLCAVLCMRWCVDDRQETSFCRRPTPQRQPIDSADVAQIVHASSGELETRYNVDAHKRSASTSSLHALLMSTRG